LDVVLVKVALEGRRRSGGCALAGRKKLAEALDADRDGGEDVLQDGQQNTKIPGKSQVMIVNSFGHYLSRTVHDHERRSQTRKL
jgi:hypothetical protein